MKKYILALCATYIAIISTSVNVQARTVGECMAKLPETIQFTYVKDPLQKVPDSFTDYEKDYPGYGYGVTYRNRTCQVSVFVYNLNKEHITANDIIDQQILAEEEMLADIPEDQQTVDQVYVTFIGENFFKIQDSCDLVYQDEEEKYNEMITRVVSSVAEENISAFMNECLGLSNKKKD